MQLGHSLETWKTKVQVPLQPLFHIPGKCPDDRVIDFSGVLSLWFWPDIPSWTQKIFSNKSFKKTGTCLPKITTVSTTCSFHQEALSLNNCQPTLSNGTTPHFLSWRSAESRQALVSGDSRLGNTSDYAPKLSESSYKWMLVFLQSRCRTNLKYCRHFPRMLLCLKPRSFGNSGLF